jgi:CRISPR-associated protein Csm1
LATGELTCPAAASNNRACLFALAGLLHDVGKILEPSGIGLTDRELRLEQLICPTDRKTGRSTHRHVLFTAMALNQASENWQGVDSSALFRLACNHHRPSASEPDESIVQFADCLASGHDRRSVLAEDEKEVTGLISVVSRLRRGEAPQEAIATTSLAFDEASTFTRSSQTKNEYAKSCKELAEALIKGLRVSFDSPMEAVARIDGLLSRVAVRVPASRSWREVPDVSLYEHSRAVGAFSACIAAQLPQGFEISQLESTKFRLLSLSVGGIQDFIFRRMSLTDVAGSQDKGTAKQLRARSLLVTLLTNLAARRILTSLGLPGICLLFDAGGRAVLLVPGDDANLSTIRATEMYLRRSFGHDFGGTLRLDMAISERLDAQSFMASRFAATYRSLLDRLDLSKLGGGARVMRHNGAWLDSGWTFQSPAMPIDREEFAAKLRLIGKSLPRARYLSIDDERVAREAHLSVFGFGVTLHETKPQGVDFVSLDLDDDITSPTLVTGNHVPRLSAADLRPDEDEREGDPVPFDRIAARSRHPDGQPLGMSMLGVLKADVDRLGWLFGYGLGDGLSFGRLATLSRSFDGFFKGFLQYRLRTRFTNMYTVFAGGDDLFLIGPWYDTIMFAQSLPADFARFSGGNPNVTLSAGLIFAKPGSSIRSLADAGDNSLDEAKNSGRNRICVAGSVLEWSEFERAMSLHKVLLRCFDADEGAKGGSLLYRLLQYSDMATRAMQDSAPSLTDLKWRSQMSYDLRRNLSSDHEELQVQLGTLGRDDAPVLRIATMLTLYCRRGAHS